MLLKLLFLGSTSASFDDKRDPSNISNKQSLKNHLRVPDYVDELKYSSFNGQLNLEDNFLSFGVKRRQESSETDVKKVKTSLIHDQTQTSDQDSVLFPIDGPVLDLGQRKPQVQVDGHCPHQVNGEDRPKDEDDGHKDHVDGQCSPKNEGDGQVPSSDQDPLPSPGHGPRLRNPAQNLIALHPDKNLEELGKFSHKKVNNSFDLDMTASLSK